MKIITCTGFGNSGSSAATDFFSEFDNVELVPHDFECTFIHEADGLYDLEKAVEEGHRFKVDLAVKRFLLLSEKLQENGYKFFFNGNYLEYTYKFIEKTINCKWNGWWHRAFETNPMTHKQEFLLEKTNNLFLKKQKYSLFENDTWTPSYSPPIDEYYDCDIAKFQNEAKKYVSKLLDELNPKKKEFLLIDQLLPPIHPEKYFHYFDNIKVIIIDRDPKDYYLCNNLFWGSRYIPSENLDTYINWYKKTRSSFINSDYTKKLYLEDLIYNYESATEKLIRFAGLSSEHHTNKGKYFVPEKSRRNTRMFDKYTNYSDEIIKISSALKEYFFDYSKVSSNLLEKITEKKEIVPVVDLLSECDEYYKNKKAGLYYYVKSFLRFVKRTLKSLSKAGK